MIRFIERHDTVDFLTTFSLTAFAGFLLRRRRDGMGLLPSPRRMPRHARLLRGRGSTVCALFHHRRQPLFTINTVLSRSYRIHVISMRD